MEIPVQRWKDAIEIRHSSRTFTAQPLSEDLCKSMEQFLDYVNNGIEGVRAVFVRDGGNKVVQSIIGSYGLIKGVRSYIAFIADQKDIKFPEKIGYLGEMCVLEATAKGLQTCWISGTFKPQTVEKQIRIAPNEKVIAITPLGYTRGKKSIVEKIMKKATGSQQRKSVEELCPEGYKQSYPKWIKDSIELARVAPSAVNKQPWRFIIGENNDNIKIRINDSRNVERKRLDCGIAMLHIEIGALSNGIEGEWSYSELPDIAVYSTK